MSSTLPWPSRNIKIVRYQVFSSIIAFSLIYFVVFFFCFIFKFILNPFVLTSVLLRSVKWLGRNWSCEFPNPGLIPSKFPSFPTQSSSIFLEECEFPYTLFFFYLWIMLKLYVLRVKLCLPVVLGKLLKFVESFDKLWF